MARLLVVGELNPDVVVTGVPVHDGRLRFGQAEDLVSGTAFTLGSSAAITASAAVRGGIATGLVAVVGDDDLGRSCLGWLAERGIDATAVRTSASAPTGSTVVLVSAADPTDRHMLTHLGTMAELTVEDLPDALLAGSEHVHVSSFFLHLAARERLHERLAAARSLGATTSLDTNDDPSRTWLAGAGAAVAQSDVLFCNDSEAIGLAGRAAEDGPSAAVDALLARMPAATTTRTAATPAVVRKLGAGGAAVRTRLGEVCVAAPRVEVVDTVGAGDTLAGTVLAAVLDGADWPAALRCGVAAASLSTAAAGGVAAQPDRAATAALAPTLALTDTRDLTQEGRP